MVVLVVVSIPCFIVSIFYWQRAQKLCMGENTGSKGHVAGVYIRSSPLNLKFMGVWNDLEPLVKLETMVIASKVPMERREYIVFATHLSSMHESLVNSQ